MDYKMADKLIEQRKKHGYSQEELADKLEISRQAISKWERAETSPDTENLIALSRLYGITIDEMLGVDNRQTSLVAEADKNSVSTRSYFQISKKHLFLAKFVSGLVMSIIGFVFLVTGLGIYLGFAFPKNRDLMISQNESFAVHGVSVMDISRSNFTINNETMYSIVFNLFGKNVKTNPIYSKSEATSKVGEIIEVRVDDNGNAVMLNYQRSGYSTLGYIFLGVFGGIGVLFLPVGLVLLRVAQIQKRKDIK